MTHYHRYQPVSDNPDGMVEVCTECKHRLVTKKDRNGRIDNNSFLKSHAADFAQPTGSTKKIYEQVYGKK